MEKFRILKVSRIGLGHWYEIEKKFWYGWEKIKSFDNDNLGFRYYHVVKFDTKESAIQYISAEKREILEIINIQK